MLISCYSNQDVEKRITEMEENNGIALPEQYRKFLLEYNGGDTPDTSYKAGRASTVVRGFYGFGEVEHSFDKLDLREWIDKGVFPIACDPFGNEIVISLEAESCGSIYFLDHEKGYAKSMIAEDLKAFVKKCKSKKIDPDTKSSIEEREAALIARGRGHVITDTLRKMWQDEIDKYGNMVQETVIIK